MQGEGCRGWLEKQSGGKSGASVGNLVNKWDRRYFVLADGVLRYFAKSTSAAAEGEPLGEVDCTEALTESEVDLARNFCFTVVTERRSLRLRAADRGAMGEWLAALARACRSGAVSARPSAGAEQLGVSLRLLRAVSARSVDLCSREGPPRVDRAYEAPDFSRRAAGASLTSDDVVREHIKLATRDSRCSYVEHLQQVGEGALGDAADVGPATLFVSHAWRYAFGDLVDAVDAFAASARLDEARTFLWLDIFVINQHTHVEAGFEWWSTTFQQCVQRIGHTLLVLTPALEPLALRRAWCLFEIWGTLQTGTPLAVTMPRAERAAFEAELQADFEGVQAKMGRIDLAAAEAWSPDDRANIFRAVEARGAAPPNLYIPRGPL